MYKIKFWMPVLVGLIAGQLFAAGDRPLKVVNTVRVGYSDNLYRNANDEKSGAFVTDIIDLSFRAVLSDRTDVMVKSQLNLLTDNGKNRMQPNLYVMLHHSVSPRLLLGLTEYYRRAERSGGDVNRSGNDKYYYYFNNNIAATADYVLTDKDRLSGSVNYGILRNDKVIDDLDTTTIGAGLSWKRELIPQRTFATLSLHQSRVTYDKQPKNTARLHYRGNDAYFDQTDLSAGLHHTFNQEWQGHVEAGASEVTPHFSDVSVNGGAPVKAGNDSTLNPLFRAGLVYSPSPITRLTGDLNLSYQASTQSGYGGQNTTELSFGAQHNLTAKLMAKATARFAHVSYDSQDSTTGNRADETQNRTDLGLRLTYKLNRMHFLEAGVRHRQTDYNIGDYSWSENRVDLGWRVEFN